MPRRSSDYQIEIPVTIKDQTKSGAKSVNTSAEKMAQDTKKSIEKEMSAVDQLQRQRSQALVSQWSKDESAKTRLAVQGLRERERAEQQSLIASQSLQRQRSAALLQLWKNEEREFARTQQNNIKAATAAAEKQAAVQEAAWSRINTAASLALAGLVAGMGAAIIDTTLFAGRTAELTIALHQMAKANNISTEAVDKQLEGLIKLNISRQEATSILAQVIGANLDYTKTTQLARIAQDTAVISGKNSSEAFQDLAQAILIGTTQAFRAAGVFISVRAELDKGSKALGLNKNALTEQQRQQILTNAVVEYGARLTGTYEAAMGSASKQMRSLTRVANDARQSFGDLFQGAFMFGVIVTKEFLEVLATYPKTFLAATTAVTLFTAAIVLTTTAAIPSMIANITALAQAIVLVGKVMMGTASLIQGATATMTVATLGWGALAIAIGLVVYALTNVETATEQAARVTVDLIETEGKAYETSKELAAAAQEVAKEQLGSVEQHEKMNAVLDRLDPVTRQYVEAIDNEARQVAALNEKLQENVELNRFKLEADLRAASGAIQESQAEVKSIQDQATELRGLMNVTDQMAQAEKSDADEKKRLQEQATYLAGSIVELNGEMGALAKTITENEAKTLAAARALGFSSQQFVEYLQKTGQAQTEIDRLTKMYEGLTPKVDQTTKALDDQAESLKKVTDELKALTHVGETEIESKVLEIVKGAKNAAEARRMAQDAMKNDTTLKDLIQKRRTATEAEKAARDVLEPKPVSKAAIQRGTRDADMISAMKNVSQELASDFEEEFGRAMKFHFGQAGVHEKQGWDHRAAFDISTDPRTAEGRFIMDWLRDHGINFRASTGPETRNGKIVSTGVHIHAGELSGAKALGLKVNEGLLSPKGLQTYLEKESLVFAPWSGQMVSQEEYTRQAAANAKSKMVLTPSGGMMSPEDAAQQAGPTMAQLPIQMEKTWDKYYDDVEKREKELAQRRKNFLDEFQANQRDMVTEIGHLELDLEQLRKQNADDQFVEQRRLLSAKQEEIELTKQITQAQDEQANGPLNESLRVQLALLQDINAIRKRDEEALKDYNRAILEMADATTYHAQQADSAVAQFLAGQKTITEVVADAKIGVMQTTFDLMDRGLSKITDKLGIMKDLVRDILSGFLRLALSQFFRSVFLGQGSGGATQAGGVMGQGGSQGGIASIPGVIQNLVSGGATSGVNAPPSISGNNSATWGTFGKALPNVSTGGGGILQKLGLGGGGLAGIAASLPFLGAALGSTAGGQSRFGNILGGVGGGLAGLLGIAIAPTSIGGLGAGIAGLSTLGLIAGPVAIALIAGAIALKINAQRRAEEKIRNEVSNDTGTAIWALIGRAQTTAMTQAEANQEWARIDTDYHNRIAQIKDNKTRRNAELQWTNDFMPLKKIVDQNVQDSIKRGNDRARMTPVFAGGGYSTASQLVKVRPGEGVRYPGSNVVHTVFGKDRGYDTEYMYAPRGTKILNQTEMRSAKPFNNGGTVGMTPASNQAAPIINASVTVDADGMAEMVIESPLFGKAVVKNVKVAKKKKQIA